MASTSGAGLGPAGVFRAGLDYDIFQAEENGQLVSSRLIDSEGRLVQVDDGTGAFEAMNDTVQCVYLAVMGVERPLKMGPGFARQYEQEIRSALSSLTEGASPRAEIISIDIPTGTDIATPRIVFRDLVDNGRTKILEP